MSQLISTPSALEDMFVGWPPPVLDPAGPYAASITFLTWVLLILSAAILLIVLIALWIAFKGKKQTRARLGGQ